MLSNRTATMCIGIAAMLSSMFTATAAAEEARPFLYSMGRFTAAWAQRDWSYDTQAWEHMQAMGATMNGAGLAWCDGEPVQGQYNQAAFDYADHEVDGILAHGMEVSFFVGLSPEWAAAVHVTDGAGNFLPHRTPPAEEFADDFIAFHTYVANYFKGRVKYYYFWNEPNGCSWINPCANSDSYPEYTKWLIRCSQAIKAVDPNAKIVGPRLDYHSGVTKGYEYIQGMYDHGAGPHIDAIAIHPYDWAGTIHWQALIDTRAVMVANGDADKPLWITEYGWNSSDYQSTADKMLQVLTELRKPEWSFVGMANYLVLNDGGGVENYGLMDADLNPRAGYHAFMNIDKTWPESVAFASNVQSGEAPLTVNFDNNSYMSGQTAWLWNFGDGTTSTEENPTHIFAQDGRYTVTLTVTGENGSESVTKDAYIAVANSPEIAFIAGTIPTNAADSSIIQHLRAKGISVDVYDDDPANRPTAPEIAAAHDVVIGSSTLLSANVAGEFRNESTPFIYWEPSLGWATREGLAEGATVVYDQTQLNVVDNTHPVMAGIDTGLVTVTLSNAAFSRCGTPVATGARVLATTADDPGLGTVIVAEPGDILLDGNPAAGKRASLYLYDDTWMKTNDTGKQIFDNAVAWMLGEISADFSAAVGVLPMTMAFTDSSTGPVMQWEWDFGDGASSLLRHPRHTYTAPGDYEVTLTVNGVSGSGSAVSMQTVHITASAYAWGDFDTDGDVDMSDFGFLQACFTGLETLPANSPCEVADFDMNTQVDQADFEGFMTCFSGPDIAASPDCHP